MRKVIIVILILLIALVAVVPVFADSKPPCEDSGGPGNSDYASHHIAFLAKQGIIGHGHVPGTAHQGFSFCNPSGK